LALLTDEGQDVGGDDLIGLLDDDSEERPQVTGGRRDGVRTAPGRDELQVAVEDWMPQLGHLLARLTSGLQTRIERHGRVSLSVETTRHDDEPLQA
jgi:hypothetical protein